MLKAAARLGPALVLLLETTPVPSLTPSLPMSSAKLALAGRPLTSASRVTEVSIPAAMRRVVICGVEATSVSRLPNWTT